MKIELACCVRGKDTKRDDSTFEWLDRYNRWQFDPKTVMVPRCLLCEANRQVNEQTAKKVQ